MILIIKKNGYRNEIMNVPITMVKKNLLYTAS